MSHHAILINMTDQDMSNLARRLHTEGKTDEQIVAALANAGLSEDETTKAMANSVQAAVIPAEKAVIVTADVPKKRWWPF